MKLKLQQVGRRCADDGDVTNDVSAAPSMFSMRGSRHSFEVRRGVAELILRLQHYSDKRDLRVKASDKMGQLGTSRDMVVINLSKSVPVASVDGAASAVGIAPACGYSDDLSAAAADTIWFRGAAARGSL
jgi:hypothetical protein